MLADYYPGLLFTKRTNVLRQDLAKSRGRDSVSIAMKFDRHLGSSAVEMPVKFLSGTLIIIFNLATSSLHKIWHSYLLPLSEQKPRVLNMPSSIQGLLWWYVFICYQQLHRHFVVLWVVSTSLRNSFAPLWPLPGYFLFTKHGLNLRNSRLHFSM